MKMTVDLKEHSYPIYIERGILKEAAERIAEVYQGSKIMIISDDRVYSYYGEALKKNLSEKYESRHFRQSTKPCWKQRFPEQT